MGEAFVLRRMDPDDLAQVAMIHAEALPHDPATLLGTGFLAAHLYPALLDRALCAQVAVQSEVPDRLLGFIVCGERSPLGLVVRRSPAAVLAAGLRAAVKTPRVLDVAVDVMLLSAHAPSGLPACELQWIAVSAEARGRGVGSRLVTSALEMLRERGVDRIWVKTLTSTPENVAFYRRHDFEQESVVRGRVFLSRSTAS